MDEQDSHKKFTEEFERMVRRGSLPKYSREGVVALSEVSAFLSGIFFTSLLILVQQPEKFHSKILEIGLSENSVITVTQLHLIAIPLSMAIVLFVFSAFFFAVAATEPQQKDLDLRASHAGSPFVLGLILFFVSFLAVLTLVDFFVSIVATVFALALFIWWRLFLPEEQ